MTTLTKILAAAIAALLFTSCITITDGKRGNGNVVSETRDASEAFDVIKAQEGLDVYVSQGSTASIEVEADENIIDLIATDIKDGVLRVHCEEQIGRATSKKVYVSADETSNIYKTPKDQYENLLTNAVTSCYKKAKPKLAEEINNIGIKFAKIKGSMKR